MDLKKKQKTNEIINDYKLKIINYENNKGIEKEKKENEKLIAKKELEREKQIEFNELRNKSELVLKIISMTKCFL